MNVFEGMIYTAIFGVILAMGYQSFGTIVNLFAYWVIMLPISYIGYKFFDLGIAGVWAALPSARSCCSRAASVSYSLWTGTNSQSTRPSGWTILISKLIIAENAVIKNSAPKYF